MITLNRSVFKRVLLLLLSFAIVFSAAAVSEKPFSASSAFSLTSTAVNDGKFTVTLAFPDVTWGGFQFVLTYDHTAVQLTADPSMPSSQPTIYSAPSSNGNASGSVTIAGGGFANITASGVVISMPFKVVNSAASSVQISVSVTKFILFDNTPVAHTAPSPVTVTLSNPGSTSSTTPPPSSSTVTDTPSSSSTVTDTPSVSSTEKTDSATSTKTDSSTSSKTDTSTKTSTKTSSKDTSTKTDTDTGTQSDTVTDSESLTDTETNFPMSDTATDTETNVTDVTDTPTDEPTVPVFSTVITATPDPEPAPQAVSTGMIALISVGVAIVFCAVLTVIGLLRHKREEE